MASYLEVAHNQFVHRGKRVLLRGVGLGGWLNVEHFMLGIPGTQSEIRAAIEGVYGEAAAEAFWQAYYRVYTSESDIRFVRELGMNTVRVPVSFNLFGAGPDEFENSVALREMDRVIALCERFGLFAVIDLHTAPGGQNPDWHSDNATGAAGLWRDASHRKAVADLWQRIALHFRDNTTVAGYDLINEPHYFDADLNQVLVTFFEECIASIRRVDPRHIVFIEGNLYARDFSMFERNLDDRLAYSFHYYPFLQIPNDLDAEDVEARLEASLFKDTTLEHLIEHLKRPIYCGETGHPLHLTQSAPVLKTFIGMLERMDISFSLWPLKDAGAMGILTPREDSAWMRLTREASENWSFWDIFSEDSILSAQGETDKSLFYKRLAAETTKANRRFGENLERIPFDVLLSALESFAHEMCDRQSWLMDAAWP